MYDQQTKVYLIGAGPGNPGLITMRGLDIIRRADVIVYDYLSNNELLAEAKPGAEFIFVGKKGFEDHVTQDEINSILVETARRLDEEAAIRTLDERRAEGAGNAHPIIARLKGGDPFVFGRGGEEALCLRDNGIPFEIVPGVTSGIAAPAFAGIPVTHRKVASSVTFITGHEDPTRDETSVDWAALAALAAKGDTLCFYMGIRSLPSITGHLMNEGLAHETPAALVRWGTVPEQETLVSTVAEVARRVEETGFAAPAIIVVGNVVGLRDKLRWYETAPLFGKRVVVTRSRLQTGVLSTRLSELGAKVLEFPTIEQTDPDDLAPLDDAIAHLPTYQWVIFTSVNGVDRFFARLHHRGLDTRALGPAKIAAVGVATAARLEEFGIIADLVPSRYVGEELARAICNSAVSDAEDPLIADSGRVLDGVSILIPRALVAGEALPRLLRENGAHVDVVGAYKTVVPRTEHVDELKQLLRSEEGVAITFTSSSTVENLFELLGADASSLLSRADLFSIGPTTTATLSERGLAPTAQAEMFTIPGLIDAICDTYAVKE